MTPPWNPTHRKVRDERGTRQARKSRGCDCPQLFRLQFHQDSSYTSRIPSYGGWRFGSAVERRGFGCPLGSLRTAEGGKSGVNAVNHRHHLVGSIPKIWHW